MPLAALADPADERYGYHMMDGGWLSMGFGFLMMVLVIAAIVVVVVLAIRWLGGPGQGGEHRAAPRSNALDILKERFARGEIDAAEYRERRQALEE